VQKDEEREIKEKEEMKADHGLRVCKNCSSPRAAAGKSGFMDTVAMR
jgi:hypothetical protein